MYVKVKWDNDNFILLGEKEFGDLFVQVYVSLLDECIYIASIKKYQMDANTFSFVWKKFKEWPHDDEVAQWVREVISNPEVAMILRVFGADGNGKGQ